VEVNGEKIVMEIFKCANKGCPKRVWVNKGRFHRELTVEHDHGGDPLNVAVRSSTFKCLEMMRANPQVVPLNRLNSRIHSIVYVQMKPREVLNSILKDASRIVVANVVQQNLIRNLQRVKKVSQLTIV